ncbi:MAG: bifunctional phosphoribosylaminoimidazolecarboxamide formyltransferase/IMP cyclohydrolase [Gammaproteobacteria bacterium]|nr:bifunctional phosphoribosylaminoimidazolecarboxamide formyltransferase/IMP cyclohydrolase [Gammaproteobacteria bacterium]MYD80372.1 bifunctional phosphoribosylaminoimidazolecarboxamide formyltransferase/IMP cyclohydrolase [Gammaproteobacteria bacterium]
MTFETGTESGDFSIKNALLSVSDKKGIQDFARFLTNCGCEVFSTGGTGDVLRRAAIPYTELSDYTGFPELMNGRVKSLHPLVHGGILSRRNLDRAEARQHGITEFDLVVVNLYPFTETICQEGSTWEDAIENIDVGGPAMIRAAAKNHDHVLVVTDPVDYQEVSRRIEKANIDECYRREMAAKAFRFTASYDATIAEYFGDSELFPDTLGLQYRRKSHLRYGENPHQKAAFYERESGFRPNIASLRQIQGKQLSFNNVADADSAMECAMAFAAPACVIVKHGNPCGVAVSSDASRAYARAHATDPTSAYGGIVAFNVPLRAETLQQVIENQFVEVVVAPSVSGDAVNLAKSRKNLRLLEASEASAGSSELRIKQVSGGLLVQEADIAEITLQDLECVTARKPSQEEIEDLQFAWRVARFVKSNAIVLAKDRRTIGIGAGQMSRVVSARIASMRAREEGLDTEGCVMASDAFFPFRDGIDSASKNGVTAVIQPGGSVRDGEVIEAANEHGMAMVLTHMRHFRH